MSTDSFRNVINKMFTNHTYIYIYKERERERESEREKERGFCIE